METNKVIFVILRLYFIYQYKILIQLYHYSQTNLINWKKLFIGDSWFGSVKSAEVVAEVGNHGIFVIKTAFSHLPKKWLDDKMKETQEEHRYQ